MVEAAWHLGPRAVALAAWHRLLGRRLARRALEDSPLPTWLELPAGDPPPALPAAHRAALLARACGLRAVAPAGDRGGAATDWHGPFPAAPHALALDLFAAGDIRPVWERNRWAELPLLAQAARLDPAGGHAERAVALLADWGTANPAFRGPNWACGQEAALRALHLALALALLGRREAPPAGARTLLALHARRILATRAYAEAQDNNHPVSEAAGLLACGLVLHDADLVIRGGRAMAAAVRRLVAPDGGFAQLSTGYHRLLLDVLAVAEWLRWQLGGPPADPLLMARAAAATFWLHRLTDPDSGATPRLGHQDGSSFADLALAGPDDARPSIERAARLFAGASAGLAEEPGCAWLDLAPPATPLARPARWRSAEAMGWEAAGARALLRLGPPRFRPGHADLLHLDLWDGPRNLLRDGGTGAYNPPPGSACQQAALRGVAAHNTVQFDGAEPMPALGRFLFGRWPRGGGLADGGWVRDRRGNRHERRVAVEGREWRVEDRVSGPFRALALRWRLAPGRWRLRPDGLEGAALRLRLEADAPLALELGSGWESLSYGEARPCPVLVARAAAPVSWLCTRIHLP